MIRFEVEFFSCLGNSVSVKNTKISLDEAFGILMSGFLRGGTGFLKGTGEIIKGSSAVNREVRVGVTHVSLEYYRSQELLA